MGGRAWESAWNSGSGPQPVCGLGPWVADSVPSGKFAVFLYQLPPLFHASHSLSRGLLSIKGVAV